MKALTLTQPWATLIALGAKSIETRSWSTAYRGPLAIHASKTLPPDIEQIMARPHFRRALQFNGYKIPSALPLGAVIAVVELLDCLEIHADKLFAPPKLYAPPRPSGATTMPLPSAQERAFGDYTPGPPWRYAWILTLSFALPKPVCRRGALSLWDWDPAQPELPPYKIAGAK